MRNNEIYRYTDIYAVSPSLLVRLQRSREQIRDPEPGDSLFSGPLAPRRDIEARERRRLAQPPLPAVEEGPRFPFWRRIEPDDELQMADPDIQPLMIPREDDLRGERSRGSVRSYRPLIYRNRSHRGRLWRHFSFFH